jgi:hypothetical protein
MRPRLGSWLALVVLLGAMAAPGAALAQAGPGNPFTPGLPQNTGSVPTTTTNAPAPLTTTTAGSSSVSGGGIAAIAAGALVILLGITFYIWRDARRRAPVKSGAVAATAGGSKPRPKPRKLSPQERRRRKRGRAR